MPGWPRWDAATHLALMEQWGVATSVLSLSSPGVHFGDDRAAGELCRGVNDFGAGLAEAHPGRFGHFASLPLPDVGGALAEVSRAFDELGSWGVTVETNAAGRYLGAVENDPLWAELDRRSAVVFVHPTSPCCGEALALSRPRPMMEFIFDSARAGADLVFTGVLRWDMAGTPFPRQISALIKAFGSERLLYGSDYCFTPAAGATAQIASVDAADQPAGTSWRALTTGNVSRLFPWLGR